MAGGGVFMRLGDLRFDYGVLTRFRSGNVWRTPSEDYTAAKGGASDRTAGGDGAYALAPVGGNDVEDEAIRCLDAAMLRARVGEDDALVLDWACTPGTAAEVAMAIRGSKPGKYAERLGVRLIDDAISRLRDLLAEDVPSNGVRAGIH
ncbi:hypothetical protein ASG43_07850 [Aureimonas sp. Leaf454]|nr:hypothetical protein ASG43_07850 [Aureimonas sp. Leaf454]